MRTGKEENRKKEGAELDESEKFVESSCLCIASQNLRTSI